MFAKYHIDSEVFSRIKGLSYKEGCNVPLDSLRYLVLEHWDFNGRSQDGEMIVNAAIADDVLDIFQELYRLDYPIERIRLIDEYGADDNLSMEVNNSSAFNYRTVAGTAKLSKHSLGLAIDINPLYNPYVKGDVVEPASGAPYIDRSKDFPYKIDHNDACYKAFTRRDFTWGGDWRSLKDYQHFEKDPMVQD